MLLSDAQKTILGVSKGIWSKNLVPHPIFGQPKNTNKSNLLIWVENRATFSTTSLRLQTCRLTDNNGVNISWRAWQCNGTYQLNKTSHCVPECCMDICFASLCKYLFCNAFTSQTDSQIVLPKRTPPASSIWNPSFPKLSLTQVSRYFTFVRFN